MVFRIYTDKIRLVNDNEEAVAQVDFPEVSEGVCEIAHIYGERSEQGREIANQLMEMAVQEIRDSGRKVSPNCVFARNWFSQHPEASDLVFSAASRAAGAAGETKVMTDTAQAARAQTAANKQAQQAQTSAAAKKTAASQKRSSNAAESSGAKSGSGKKTMEEAYDELDNRSLRRGRGSEMNEAEYRYVRSGGAGMKILARILMVVCALCMAGIIYYFGIGVYSSISSLMEGSLISLVACGAFLIFCVVEFFWIFTRRKFYYRDHVTRVDKGRGLIGFVIVLVIGFLSFSSKYGFANFSGMNLFISVMSNNINTIILLGIVGILLCVARRLISR